MISALLVWIGDRLPGRFGNWLLVVGSGPEQEEHVDAEGRMAPASGHLTTDPGDRRLGHGVDSEPIPQHDVYLVLGEEERAKGFNRPLIQTYVHARDLGGCGVETTMGRALSETYAHEPGFYGATYCVGCRMHKEVGEGGEFYWSKNGEPILSEGRPWKVGT